MVLVAMYLFWRHLRHIRDAMQVVDVIFATSFYYPRVMEQWGPIVAMLMIMNAAVIFDKFSVHQLLLWFCGIDLINFKSKQSQLEPFVEW